MIRPRTLIDFLVFREDAILQIAASRRLWGVGLLFVIAAGIAREYDGEYLVAEPWHLCIPLFASLLGCLVMTAFVYSAARSTGMKESTFSNTFLSYLNLYWMTAPLALLYAIPFERIFSPATATLLNLCLLAIVATWRVSLMVRSVSILHETSFRAAFVPVILFSSILAQVALWLVPGPIFFIMGGVRLTDSESLILSVRMMIGLASGLGLFLWTICYAVVCAKSDRWFWCLEQRADADRFKKESHPSKGLWLWAGIFLVMLLPFLPQTQAEQKLRFQAETFMKGAEYGSFVELTNQHSAKSFPPHWDPPPRIGYGEFEPPIKDLIKILDDLSASDWIMEIFRRKMDSLDERMAL